MTEELNDGNAVAAINVIAKVLLFMSVLSL